MGTSLTALLLASALLLLQMLAAAKEADAEQQALLADDECLPREPLGGGCAFSALQRRGSRAPAAAARTVAAPDSPDASSESVLGKRRAAFCCFAASAGDGVHDVCRACHQNSMAGKRTLRHKSQQCMQGSESCAACGGTWCEVALLKAQRLTIPAGVKIEREDAVQKVETENKEDANEEMEEEDDVEEEEEDDVEEEEEDDVEEEEEDDGEEEEEDEWEGEEEAEEEEEVQDNEEQDDEQGEEQDEERAKEEDEHGKEMAKSEKTGKLQQVDLTERIEPKAMQQGKKLGAAFCCFASAVGGDVCNDCYLSAKAEQGTLWPFATFCTQDRAGCAICGGVWCNATAA